MKKLIILTGFFGAFLLNSNEMIFGKETLTNGINVVFEAAPKDIVYPEKYFLKEKNTDIHIEMLINWSDESPTGSPAGGFIPYLDVLATIKNKDGKSMKVKLTPHLNITDNFHYAQNIQLPGKIDDLYEVTIEIIPPKNGQLGIHFDWNQNYGFLVEKQKFIYTDLSFEDIAKQSRR